VEAEDRMVEKVHVEYLVKTVCAVAAYMYFYSVSSVFLLDNVSEITAREVFDITTKTGCLVKNVTDDSVSV
jgi:hypothetical protein